MKTLMFIFLVFVLAGCATKRRCLRLHPPQVERVVETKIITRDTTIFVVVAPEIQTDTVHVYIDRRTGLIHSPLSRLETSYAWSTAQVVDSRMQHALHQRDTLIEQRIQDAIRTTDRVETITEIVEVERPASWFHKIAIGWLIVSFCFLIFRVVKMIKF